jgi:DNA-binding transcriptional ArsR family regulator
MSPEATEHTEPTLERAVAVLRAMAYEHRLHILMLLRGGEKSPAELAEAMAADATSIAHHLRFLKDARLIRRQRRGRNVYYTLHSEATRRLVADVLRYAENST